MQSNINLLKLVDGKICIPTDGTKKITWNGEIQHATVYKIDLSYLRYNVENGRIASDVTKEEMEIQNVNIE